MLRRSEGDHSALDRSDAPLKLIDAGGPGLTLDGRSHLSRWYETVAERPAVQRAISRVEALVPAA